MSDSQYSPRTLMLVILEEVATAGKAHKVNLVGRAYQAGALERRLNCTFTSAERAVAYRAVERLQSDGLMTPTLDDLADPESWLQITERGRVALQRRALDALDEKLHAIDAHLVTIRDGAWSAIASSEPDALRQAAHSGRELIDQVLKTAAPDPQVTQQSWYTADGSSKSGVTRRQRLRYIMQAFRNGDSESNLKVAEKACELVLAIDEKLQGLAHGRRPPLRPDVEDAMSAAEIALRRVLVGDD